MYREQLEAMVARLREHPAIDVRHWSLEPGGYEFDAAKLRASIERDANDRGLTPPGKPRVPEDLRVLVSSMHGFGLEWRTQTGGHWNSELFFKGPETNWLDSGDLREFYDDELGPLRWNLLPFYPGGFEHKLLVELYPEDPACSLWYWIDDGDKFPLELDITKWWEHMLKFGAYTGWERLFCDIGRMDALRRAGSPLLTVGMRNSRLRGIADTLLALFGEEAAAGLHERVEEYEELYAYR